MLDASYPKNKEVIVGAGIIGFIHALYLMFEAKQTDGEMPRVTMLSSNKKGESAAEKIAPSRTPDEIVAVVPPVERLLAMLEKNFVDDPSGIRVNDVPGIMDSEPMERFIEEVKAAEPQATDVLLALGKASMEEWEKIFTQADPELRQILIDSNYHPCSEPEGYRVDYIYGVDDAQAKATGMMQTYAKLGYTQCKILSPQEVEARDETLSNFCRDNTCVDENGERQWNKDAIAVKRPGGCIDASILFPKLEDYLRKKMGTYINKDGETQNRFRVKYEREVIDVTYSPEEDHKIQGLKYLNLTQGEEKTKTNERYEVCDYVFCPGGSVGTLEKLGFAEPASIRFAGTALKLMFLPDSLKELGVSFPDGFNQYMEVHTNHQVLAWQAQKREDGMVRFVMAGLKSAYGHKQPQLRDEFTQVSTLRQLEMFRRMYPDLIRALLGKEGPVTKEDLDFLVEKGIATREVDSRAVAYDGNPTVDHVHKKETGKEIKNGLTITHAGSGGVSFAPGLVAYLGRQRRKEEQPEALRALEPMVKTQRTALKMGGGA